MFRRPSQGWEELFYSKVKSLFVKLRSDRTDPKSQYRYTHDVDLSMSHRTELISANGTFITGCFMYPSSETIVGR